MKGIEEAIGLRNHVLEQLDKADSTTDEDVRRKALTFVFVGGGFAGAETIGEVEDMARDAAKYYTNVSREDMRFVLVDAADKILPEVGPKLGQYGKEHLESRGVEVYLNTSMDSCVDGHVVLKNGLEVDSNTIVWTAGVKPNPVLSRFGLPLGPRGHVDAAADPPGHGHRLHLGRGRQRPGAGRRRPQGRRRERLVPAERPARAASGQGPRRQRDLRHAGLPAEGVRARQQGCGGGPRPPQGRRDDRHGQDEDQAQGPSRLVHAPWLPRPGDADLEPQDPRLRRLDPRHVPQARGRLPRRAWRLPREEFYEAAKPAPVAAGRRAEDRARRPRPPDPPGHPQTTRRTSRHPWCGRSFGVPGPSVRCPARRSAAVHRPARRDCGSAPQVFTWCWTFRDLSSRRCAPCRTPRRGSQTLVEQCWGPAPGPHPRLGRFARPGRPDAPALVVRNRRALRRLLWKPGELGLARAWVAGDLDIDGDLYAALGPDRRAACGSAARTPGASPSAAARPRRLRRRRPRAC